VTPFVWVVERVWKDTNQVDAWSTHGTSWSDAAGAAEDRNIENRNKEKYSFRARKYVAVAL
jgi:hypothetical protein